MEESAPISSPLKALTSPRSVAVVGASPRAESAGFRVIRNLVAFGYSGKIFPVNPRYRDVAELPCYPALSELPETPDVVFVAVPAAAGPEILAQAGDHGIRAAVVNASGFADGDEEGKALEARLRATATAGGIALCGPNNMGLINVHDRVALWTSMRLPSIQPGALAIVSQSGSVAIALSQDERKLGLSHIVSTGNETVLTVADYLEHLGADDRVRAIALFLETIRDPNRFAVAAAHAAERGKKIIALKVGRTERARAAANAHTGALSGDDRVYDAFLRRHGVLRVRDLDELVELSTLVVAYPSPPTMGNLVLVSLSGGDAALLADTAAQAGLTLSDLSDVALEKLRPLFPAYAQPKNPVDAWGFEWSGERFERILDGLTSDPTVGVIGFGLDVTASGGADTSIACDMARCCAGRVGKTTKRLVFFNNMGGGLNDRLAVILREAGIPYLSGMRPALAAIARWMEAGVSARPTSPQSSNPVPGDEWRRRVERIASVSERGRFQLLTDAGVPMAVCRVVDSPEEAVAAAGAVGYPVALKASGRQVMHKSDAGLVRLNLRDAGMVREAFADLCSRLREFLTGFPEIVVQPMIGPAMELIIGFRNDPAFGTLVVAGLGGVYVEVFGEAALSIAPVDEAEATRMLRQTHAATLLDGVRGRGPYDLAAAARAIVGLSRLGEATRGYLAAVEVNPLMVLEAGRGVVGVDVLLEPIQRTGQGASHGV